MSQLIFRRYQPSDAQAVSQLFREIYGDHYGRPDIYLPAMISQHNTEGRWQSIVAVDDKRVLGHAALCLDAISLTAEMALMAVHPAAQGQSVATLLGSQLIELSESLKLESLSIKQVSHHPYTQRMAAKIGFHSTGLLPDYIASPLADPLRETMVLGYHINEGHARPLPNIPWPDSCRAFMLHLCSVFGTHQGMAPCLNLPMQIEQHHERFEMLIQRLNKHLLDQIRHLPRHWLISVKLELSWHFAEELRSLSALGFTFTGLMATQYSKGWFALFHRGAQTRHLDLHCPHMQKLHDDLQQNGNTHSSNTAQDRACSAA
ncbi:GNAT family N-acetyltransferase [Pseudomonas sp. LT1P18]|uniref:GNAT family N-acetyltransferase n=1 Tax=Pseudomonas arabinosi TaxID=3398357 RepID=UPI0039EFEDAF